MTDFGFDWHMDLFEGWDTDDLFRHYNHVTGKVREAIATGRPETLERDFEICEAIRTTLHKRGVAYRQAYQN
tara:strand:- start:288 stop:503 length:216 start_codon:yes stop_codon:yes gene_type:complete